MSSASQGDDLVDVVVRLPRESIENTLRSMPASAPDRRQRRLREVKALLACRRRRSACFGGIRFSDPSWNMMLELFIASREGRILAVSQLCELSGSSTTTALRHIENMEALQYLIREVDPTDRRRMIVTMLPRLADALDDWLDLRLAASQIGA